METNPGYIQRAPGLPPASAAIKRIKNKVGRGHITPKRALAKELALTKPLTPREAEFIRYYKECFQKTFSDNKSIRYCADKMGIGQQSARHYRYQSARVARDIREWKLAYGRGMAKDGNAVAAETISVRWISDQLKYLFEALKKGGGKINDMVSILNSMVNILSKFNNEFSNELELVKNMSNRNLLYKFTSLAGKIFGNERAGEILAQLMYQAQGGIDAEKNGGKVKREIEKLVGMVDGVESGSTPPEEVPGGGEGEQTGGMDEEEGEMGASGLGSVGEGESLPAEDETGTEVQTEECPDPVHPELRDNALETVHEVRDQGDQGTDGAGE